MLQGQAQHTENRSPCLPLMSGRLRFDGQTWIYEVKPVGAVLGLLRYEFESSLVYVIKSWEEKLAEGLAGPWLEFDADFDRIADFLKAALPGRQILSAGALIPGSPGEELSGPAGSGLLGRRSVRCACRAEHAQPHGLVGHARTSA